MNNLFVMLAVVALVLFAVALLFAWVLMRFGRKYYVVGGVVAACLFGAYLGFDLDDTYPMKTKVWSGLVCGLGGSLALFLPVYLGVRARKRIGVFLGAVVGAVLTTFLLPFLMFVTFFRG